MADVAPIAAWLSQHPTSRTHQATFGSFDPLDAGRFFDDAVHLILGARATAFIDYQVGQVVVACAVLSDGRRVALKLYPPGYESPAVLSACREVQRQAVRSGLPAPEPFALADTDRGLLAVDSYAPGERDECRNGPRRFALATLLADVVEACAGAVDLASLKDSRLAKHPAAFAVSPATPPEVIEVIDRLTRVVTAAPTRAIVHLDWRTQNVAWNRGQVVAIYDWDSVTATPEAVAVGCAAGMFSYDFRDPAPHVPTPDEVIGFIHDYPRPIDPTVARAAAGLKMLGYAETERRLDPSGEKLGARSYRTALGSAFNAYVGAFGGG